MLLSRYGPRLPAAVEVVERLQQQGVEVMVLRCDISSQSQLKSVLEDCSRSMPAVKSCVQATMQVEDSLLENMTYSQWELSLKSKVQATWNLNTLLPSVDFFIMLSSLSGIYGVLVQGLYIPGWTGPTPRGLWPEGRVSGYWLDEEHWRDCRQCALSAAPQVGGHHGHDRGHGAHVAIPDVYCDPRLPILGPD